MQIQNSTLKDIPVIFHLYRLATEYQREKFPANVWPEFEPGMVEAEVRQNRQWKMLIDDRTACIWATSFTDPQIWEERNADPAVYIHRIATHPDHRGKDLVKQIVVWARDYARQHQKQFIRMDTCGHNKKLIDYYTRCGFNFIGMHQLKDTRGLPCHYEQADVCFFEIKLNAA